VAVLAQTYSGSPQPSYLREALTKIDQEVKDFQEDASIDLRGKYETFLVAKVQQANYLDQDNLGVCCAFCIDWISRRQHTNRAKASLAVSKKTSRPGPNELVASAELPKDLDEARIKKAIERRIGPAQQLYEEGTKKSAQGALDAIQAVDLARETPKGYFARMCGRHVRIGPDFKVNPASPPAEKEGERVFRELLSHCKPPIEKDKVKEWQDALKEAQGGKNPGLVLLCEEELKKALANPNNPRRAGVDPQALSYVISLKGAEAGGHAIALYLDGLRWTFFDPNYGEFEFPRAAEENMYGFCNDLWFNYRARSDVSKRMYQWVLEEFFFVT
jgi:hypothetical protein